MWFESLTQHLSLLAQIYLPRLTTGVVILILGFVVAVVAQKVVLYLLRRTAPEVQLFVGRVTYIGVLIGVILWVLSLLKVQIAALATIMGAVGLAIGLSLQDMAKNFVAGVYLLIERPLRVGDQITVRTFTGRVEVVGLRTTILRTGDDQQAMVPNTVIMSEVVVRKSHSQVPENQDG